MYCNNCGAQIANNSGFCPECGQKIGSASNNTQQPVIVNVVNKNENTNNNINGKDSYPYKSRWVAFFLCLFLGEFGFHRFYVGKIFTGVIWLFSLGFFGLGWLIDLITLLLGGFRDKAGMPLR